jgi:hypothetical protein
MKVADSSQDLGIDRSRDRGDSSIGLRKVARQASHSVRCFYVRKVLVDMYVAPATRRWGRRMMLAVVVAIAIGYLPAQVLARDPRAPGLLLQVDGLEQEILVVERHNRQMLREIEALRVDVSTIETRARVDLGMVYPQEMVLRRTGDARRQDDQPSESVPGAGR